jgi:hypothetical protein
LWGWGRAGLVFDVAIFVRDKAKMKILTEEHHRNPATLTAINYTNILFLARRSLE